MSSKLPKSTGVPHGSVLGPLLFLIYIYISTNDLHLVNKSFTMLMYADDTTLYCNVNNDVTDNILYCELSKICD